MALAPLLYNITFDSQSRILYFWDKAGHEIYHCEIPSPAPALPTVTREYLYPSTSYGQIINVPSDSTCNAWRMSGSVYSGVLYDDTTKKQCIFGWQYYESSTWYPFYGGIETVNNQGAVGAKNTTSGTIKVVMWRYAECSSPDATVVTVYDSSNNPYNAFKYTSDGTDYYYVLDGTQTDWTDNLSSIGYHVPPALPTVSMSGDFGENNWLFCNNSGRNQQVSPDNIIYVYSLSGTAIWDNTKSYAVLLWATYQDSQGHGSWGFSVEKGSSNNYFYARNVSTSALYLYCLRVAVCSSSDATVITVYDSSNNPYNAFKYTSDGADYYYVLDGTQTDWTDDLASIGYRRTIDDLSKPLMLKATQDNSSVALSRAGSISNSYQYSLDGTTWNQYTLNTSIPLSADEYVFFKRLSGSSTPSSNNHHYFVMTGKIEAYNNINSMFFDSGWETADTLTTWCGAYLFDGCSALTRAPALPATTLSTECYYRMFRNCTSLTNAPYMCAENLATYCCEFMFEGCTSLVNAPELSAMTLASYCYFHMFEGCTSLVNAPNLSATTLADNCYGYMFKNCTSLVNAPALPAITLADNCYHDMFWNCISLTKAPVLPVTVLATNCYSYMFEDCSNLSEIHILATDISASGCLSHWLEDASSTGDIYCVNGVSYPVGISGIPSGWTRHDI